jgi:hypothetical protein
MKAIRGLQKIVSVGEFGLQCHSSKKKLQGQLLDGTYEGK